MWSGAAIELRAALVGQVRIKPTSIDCDGEPLRRTVRALAGEGPGHASDALPFAGLANDSPIEKSRGWIDGAAAIRERRAQVVAFRRHWRVDA